MVEEAGGGESSATSFLERDEKGFRESEVCIIDISVHIVMPFQTVEMIFYLK